MTGSYLGLAELQRQVCSEVFFQEIQQGATASKEDEVNVSNV